MASATTKEAGATPAENIDRVPSDTTSEAHKAWLAERESGFWEAIRANKRAVAWSCLISLSIVMEGYDTGLLLSFFAYPAFQRKYGEYVPALQQYQLTGPWQAGLSDGQTIGQILGAFVNGWAASRFGYRPTILAALLVLNATLLLPFFADSAAVLLAGQLLNGVPWGIFATTGPAYASEVLPLALRGYLSTYCNLCWAAGQLIANGVLQGLVDDPTEWSYRIPFALQWIWPLPLTCVLFFAPESPWFLVKAGRYADARNAIGRLADKTDDEVGAALAQMRHTIRLEDEIQAGSRYLDCFRGVDLRRTEVCCVAWAGQMTTGAIMAFSAAYFFQAAGLSVDNAYKVSIGTNAIAFVGTVMSWFLMAWLGRRTIYLVGLTGIFTVLFIIGLVSVSTATISGAWAQASLLLVWHLTYSLTLGPIAYAIVSETSAVRLRAKTVVLARSFYNVALIVAAVIGPYMLNPAEWNWQGKAGFFWAGTTALTALWAYFRLPEGKGRSFEELDMLFAQKISARKFKSTNVTVYGDLGGKDGNIVGHKENI
ncbi:general substrate transporter [Xylariaceae sp. FL0016]|nr:general substrate transporter [Xylariaceae sp. FL0016]